MHLPNVNSSTSYAVPHSHGLTIASKEAPHAEGAHTSATLKFMSSLHER